MDDATRARITARIEALEKSLKRALEGGADPDSYNIGWLEGAIHELEQFVVVAGSGF